MKNIPWKPMNSAPRDGTYIYIWCDTHKSIFETKYIGNGRFEEQGDNCKFTGWITQDEYRAFRDSEILIDPPKENL